MENKIISSIGPRARVAFGVFLCLGVGFLAGYQVKRGGKTPESGYTTEYGDFVPWTCERTIGNSDEFPDGVERYTINTGRDFETICNHEALVTPEDCKEPQHPEWAGVTVNINYRTQHRVCVSHMPGIYKYFDGSRLVPYSEIKSYGDIKRFRSEYQGDITRCFDLYDIGER